ncbi:hypothetical protein F4802DRAFT_586708 [Xylaria palmicola]|nr:hypothetical protein F4802DRAFT_586708 [Xylaria palmicola]
MKEKSASQHALKMRRQPSKMARGINKTAKPRRKRKQRSQKAILHSNQLGAIFSDSSQHRMTLRSTNKRDLGHDASTDVSTQRPQVKASIQPAPSTVEPVVRASSTMPQGYSFVPKGNPYLTRNCRQQTQRARQVIYVVVNDKKKQVGIRVPSPIYAEVLQAEEATRVSRKKQVIKRDEGLENQFREAILSQFPRIPPDEVSKIARHATAKGEGRVGRTETIEMGHKARLAAQAHIRHTKTDYDSLLKKGIGRTTAREMTSEKVLDILKEWRMAPKSRNASMKSNRKVKARKASSRSGSGLDIVKKMKHS